MARLEPTDRPCPPVPDAYPLYSACGAPRTLGRLHGEQARAQIRAFIENLGDTLKLPRGQLRERALRFLPLFERHCPQLVDEVHGLAAGAAIPLAEALAVQIRGELGHVPAGGCTTFVIAGRGTASGQVLIGQNSDVEPELQDFAYVLRLQPEAKPAVLMWTFGGMLGYHGLNAAGVAHFANSLGGGPAWRMALPHYPVKRRMLEQRSLDDVLGLLGQMPVCSNGNYVLCDGAGHIADVELTTEGFAIHEDPPDGFIAHSNHFVCAPHASPAADAASVPDSFPRLARMRSLIAGRFGGITIEDLKRFLADHDGQPTSICRHPHAGPDHASVSARSRTAASLIAEPAAGRLHVARGNPCRNGYVTYQLG
jgi:isopenicillin-N N-acyltransferase-like protein